MVKFVIVRKVKCIISFWGKSILPLSAFLNYHAKCFWHKLHFRFVDADSVRHQSIAYMWSPSWLFMRIAPLAASGRERCLLFVPLGEQKSKKTVVSQQRTSGGARVRLPLSLSYSVCLVCCPPPHQKTAMPSLPCPIYPARTCTRAGPKAYAQRGRFDVTHFFHISLHRRAEPPNLILFTAACIADLWRAPLSISIWSFRRCEKCARVYFLPSRRVYSPSLTRAHSRMISAKSGDEGAIYFFITSSGEQEQESCACRRQKKRFLSTRFLTDLRRVVKSVQLISGFFFN